MKNILCSLLFCLYILSLLSLSWAGGSKSLTTDLQFYSGEISNLQVEGQGANAKLELLNSWTNLNPLNVPPARKYSPLVYDEVNRKIILFGGLTGTTDLGDTWVYDITTNHWEQRFPANPPSARYGHILTYLGEGKTLFFGGKNSQNVFFNDTYIYNFVTNSWEKKEFYGVVPSSRAASSAVALGNGTLLLFGGYNNEGRCNDTWKYELSSWSKLSPANSPSARDSAGMSYDSVKQKVILFGGFSGAGSLNDTWVYDFSLNTWINKNPSSAPAKRYACCLTYDAFNRTNILFGGVGATLYSDTWIYDLEKNQWLESSPLSSPGRRYGYGLVYLPDTKKVYLFGGYEQNEYNDTWEYVLRSSGTFISPFFDVPFNTTLTWDSLTVTPQAAQPNTELRFQIATSYDFGNWTEFVGYDGTGNSYYTWIGYPIPIWSGHRNQRYLKLKAYFKTTQQPYTPILDIFTINFNRGPYPPTLSSPTYNSSTNSPTPLFVWNNAVDDDNDVLTYDLQVDAVTDFSSPDINLSGIQSSLPQSSTSSAISLPTGRWYWRVRANDSALNSQWSEIYTFWIDTTPLQAVNDLTVRIGSKNGALELSWTNPGDDGLLGNISKGTYWIKWSSAGQILTEQQWINISDEKKWSTLIVPNEKTNTLIENLANATTYYFVLRIIDDADNLSPLSNSGMGFTNAPPAVILLSPNRNENWTKVNTICWTYSDPNPDDTEQFAIYLSTDNGVNYSLQVTSGLPDGTTFYFWDTRQAANTDLARIKVVATDQRGLSGEGASVGYFSIFNLNESPTVTVIFPNRGETLSGEVNLTWIYLDPNRSDTQKFELWLSSDNGQTWGYKIDEVYNCTWYHLLTRGRYPNGVEYQLKIKITDSGTPQYSSEDTSDQAFKIDNNNQAPQPFSLLYPETGIYISPLTIYFQWENAVDPNPEDKVTYTLWYSTDSSFVVKNEIRNLVSNLWRPSGYVLNEQKTYFWKVKADDPFGLFTWSKETNFFFTLSRSKVDSIDFLVHAEVLEGLPENGYLRVDKIYASEYQSLSLANRRSLSDSLTRTISEYAYRIGIYDYQNNQLFPKNLKLKISVRYFDENNDGYFDGLLIPIENLHICSLEEKSSNPYWKSAVYPQEINPKEKKVTAIVNYSSIFSLLGYSPANVYLSEIKNYPNPFNPRKEQTEISYILTQDSRVTIRIYNLVGDPVRTYENAPGEGQSEGFRNFIKWDGKNDNGMTVANGVYLCAIFAHPSAGGEQRKLFRLIGVVK